MSGFNLRCFLRPCALALVCLSLGCHLLNLAPPVPERTEADLGPAAPSKHGFRVAQYVFLYDFELKHNLPLFRELADLRDQVYKELQLPSSNVPIQVYIFENRDHYERFMSAKYPDLPRRRAFFVAQAHTLNGPEDLLVYTYWGDRLKEDLRHELTHALLHSVLKDVPLWLDEGLAEYFEVAPECKGTHYQHLNQLRRGTGVALKPDLARLEQLSQVQQMAPAEYREAWAWVHLMLRDKPEAKAVLLGYLQQLRSNSTPGLLGPRLAVVFPQLNEALENHLARLDSGISPAPTAQR
jgi:hypothetical protein